MQLIRRVENYGLNVLNVLAIFLLPRLKQWHAKKKLYFSSIAFVWAIFSFT